MKELFLRIEKVSKTYFKKHRILKEALKGVSLDLYQGEVLGLLGVNGSGKTTLVSILATLHPPTSGEIFWKRESIYDVLLSYPGPSALSDLQGIQGPPRSFPSRRPRPVPRDSRALARRNSLPSRAVNAGSNGPK